MTSCSRASRRSTPGTAPRTSRSAWPASRPVSVALRRLARARPDIRAELFGDDPRLPMVFQYNPLIHFMEVNDERELVCTVSRLDLLSPRMRYNVHDQGGLVEYARVKADPGPARLRPRPAGCAAGGRGTAGPAAVGRSHPAALRVGQRPARRHDQRHGRQHLPGGRRGGPLPGPRGRPAAPLVPALGGGRRGGHAPAGDLPRAHGPPRRRRRVAAGPGRVLRRSRSRSSTWTSGPRSGSSPARCGRSSGPTVAARARSWPTRTASSSDGSWPGRRHGRPARHRAACRSLSRRGRPPRQAEVRAMSPRRWTLVAVAIGSGVVFLDGTVVNVALDTIGRELPAVIRGPARGPHLRDGRVPHGARGAARARGRARRPVRAAAGVRHRPRRVRRRVGRMRPGPVARRARHRAAGAGCRGRPAGAGLARDHHRHVGGRGARPGDRDLGGSDVGVHARWPAGRGPAGPGGVLARDLPGQRAAGCPRPLCAPLRAGVARRARLGPVRLAGRRRARPRRRRARVRDHARPAAGLDGSHGLRGHRTRARGDRGVPVPDGPTPVPADPAGDLPVPHVQRDQRRHVRDLRRPVREHGAPAAVPAGRPRLLAHGGRAGDVAAGDPPRAPLDTFRPARGTTRIAAAALRWAGADGSRCPPPRPRPERQRRVAGRAVRSGVSSSLRPASSWMSCPRSSSTGWAWR